MEPADRVAPRRGDKSRTDTQDAQGLCVAAHDSVPLHALKANNVGSVEKPADEEPSGRRFLEWVVRHEGWARSESIQPVAKTGGYCWRIPVLVLNGPIECSRKYRLSRNKIDESIEGKSLTLAKQNGALFSLNLLELFLNKKEPSSTAQHRYQ